MEYGWMDILDSHGLRLRWRGSFQVVQMRREMPSCTIYSILLQMLWVLDRPPATPRHPQLAWLPASRTLESHNTMQQRQHASSPFPKVYSMYLSSNCSLPYVFSNSFHPRISTGHQGMHMYLAWLLVFCLFWEGWLLVCWVDLALGWMGLETPLSPLDVRSPS